MTPSERRHALRGQDIVCISSIDWDFIWQGHQEIMATLAAQGNRVLFVENTGVRPLRIGDMPRIRSRIRNWWRGTKGFREERKNLVVFSPVVLPFPYSRVAQWVNATLMLRIIKRWMRTTRFHNPVVWTFLPTPLARALIQGMDGRLTVYYCIDDLRSSSSAARKITTAENQLLREADLVFVTSEKLRERATQFNQHVHLFPFAVSYERFEQVRLAADEVPPEIQKLPRPVVGYVGGLHRFVDQQLVCAIADAMPEASIALIGPTQTDISAMEQRSNVHVFGARPHSELPGYIKGFDVGLVPYTLSEYTAHVYPTKLNEYLAMGIPVVAIDLPEIHRFNEKHRGIVATAQPGDTNGFLAAVRHAVHPSSRDEVEQRLQVAKDNSWSSRLAEMSVLVDAAIERREGAAERWELALGRLYRSARQRTVPAVVAVVAAYLIVFHTPALWLAASPLLVASSPSPADAIVVLGGGVGESGRPGGSHEERVKAAVDLYRAGFAPNVVFSSGFVYLFKEAEVMKALAVAQGVPESAIVLETKASGTRENVLFVREIAEDRGWRRVLVVSSPYHMRRAMMAWRKLAPDIQAVPTPVARSGFYGHEFGASAEQIRGIAQEYAALVYYWVNGWL